MGMNYCDFHWLTGITTCCGHVRHACDTNRFERVNIELNGWAEPIFVCDGCLAQTQAQHEAKRAAGVRGWFFELAPRERYACSDCFVEWYAATKQGDLTANIRRARADVGIEDVCEVHGEVERARCCVHIDEAVEVGGSERAHAELDGWGNPTARRAAANGLGMWRFDLEPPERYPCGEHVKEWLRATGQSALTDEGND